MPKENQDQDLEMNKINDKNKNKQMNKGYQFCNRCLLFIDINSDVSHCEDCNVCVEGI